MTILQMKDIMERAIKERRAITREELGELYEIAAWFWHQCGAPDGIDELRFRHYLKNGTHSNGLFAGKYEIGDGTN